MAQHFSSRGGSSWTRTYPPLKVIKDYKRIPQKYYLGMEAKVTAELMWKYGVNNVRGAMFSRPTKYTVDDIDALVGFLGHYNELVYRDLYQDLKEMLPLSSSSSENSYNSREFTPNTVRQARWQSNKENGACFKCGEKGHKAVNCPKGRRCFQCGKFGHLRADCPNL